MEQCAVALKFTTPVHFGRRDSELVSTAFWAASDQLFGAIVSCFSALYGDAETAELLSHFERGEFPFVASSSFLMIDGERPTYFLPKPLGVRMELEGADAKKRKKISYVPIDVLKSIAMGKAVTGHKPAGQFLVPDWMDGSPVCEDEIPRVALDSITASSNLFYMTAVRFAENAGLYFLLDYDSRWERKIKAAIRYLGDEGLGGERTYGFGHFECEFRTAPYWNLDGGDRLLLSGYYPSDDELESVKAGGVKSYRLRDTGGYIYSGGDTGLRKPWVKLFAEGAVLSFLPRGSLVDVTPSVFARHKVYRSGLAYTLPWIGGN